MLGFGKAFPVNILWIWKLDFESKTLLNFGVGKRLLRISGKQTNG